MSNVSQNHVVNESDFFISISLEYPGNLPSKLKFMSPLTMNHGLITLKSVIHGAQTLIFSSLIFILKYIISCIQYYKKALSDNILSQALYFSRYDRH